MTARSVDRRKGSKWRDGAYDRRKKPVPNPITGFEEVEDRIMRAIKIMGWICMMGIGISIGIMIL